MVPNNNFGCIRGLAEIPPPSFGLKAFPSHIIEQAFAVVRLAACIMMHNTAHVIVPQPSTDAPAS
jgi:hypothetical protein